MRNLGRYLLHFIKCEDGPTAVEYAVMLALIIAVVMAAVAFFGNATSNTFDRVGQSISVPG